MSLAPLMSSAKQDWQTPEVVRSIVHAVRDGWSLVDPCTVDANPMGADVYYTPNDNGLDQPWGADVVYCNPPYGRQIGYWVDKCAETGRSARVVVALLPARTDTRWFPWDARRICFWKGRLTFKGAPAPAPFPSALVFWGTDQSLELRFATLAARYGRVVVP